MATAFRTAKFIQWDHADDIYVAYWDIHNAMQVWTQIEISLGTVCANLPALAALGRTLWQQHKSSARSGGQENLQHYELRAQGGVSSTKSPRTFSSSEEHIVSKDRGIIQSTQIKVDYEER